MMCILVVMLGKKVSKKKLERLIRDNILRKLIFNANNF